jgi:flagellar biosynthetic protein FliR
METVFTSLGLPAWGFVLVLARIFPILVLAPPINSLVVPRKFRLGFAALLAVLLTPSAANNLQSMPNHWSTAVVACGGELIVGLLLGSVLLLSVAAFELAGRIVGQLSGLEMATLVGGFSGSGQRSPDSTVIVQLFSLVALFVLLTSGGHRLFLQLCLDGLASYPVGTMAFEHGWLIELEHLLTHTFRFGLQVAAPFALALVMVNIAGGLIARAMPSAHILAIGFSVNSLAVLALVSLCLGGSAWLYQSEMISWLESCQRMMTFDQ